MKLYTKTVCPKCLLVKNALTRNNIEFETLNIDENEKAKQVLIDNEIMSVPVLELSDGVTLLFNVPEIMEKIEELA